MNVGNICAVENPPGNFKRCQVISAPGTEASDMHRDVEIRCIDDGDIVSVKVSYRFTDPEPSWILIRVCYGADRNSVRTLTIFF